MTLRAYFEFATSCQKIKSNCVHLASLDLTNIPGVEFLRTTSKFLKSLCVLKPRHIRRFHLVALQWTSKKCTKNCAARARLFSLRRSCCRRRGCLTSLLGSLSSDVFERCTSTGSEPFSLLMCLDASKFALRSVFTF